MRKSTSTPSLTAICRKCHLDYAFPRFCFRLRLSNRLLFSPSGLSIDRNFNAQYTYCRIGMSRIIETAFLRQPYIDWSERRESNPPDDSHGQARGVLLSSVGYDRTPRGLWDESINLFRAGLFLPSAPLSALRPHRMEARHQQEDSSKWKRQPTLGASSVSQGYCLQWL